MKNDFWLKSSVIIMKIISWNVNGIRSNIVDTKTSAYKKLREIEKGSALHKIIQLYDPDVICFQETRLGPDLYKLFESDMIKSIFPYQYWSSSKGEKSRSANRYSGTAIWSKIEATSVSYDIPHLNDKEGRFIQVNFPTTIVITTYTPNTGSNWDYRLDIWEPAIRKHLKKLSLTSSIPVVYCGDNNIANKEDVWFGDCLEVRMKSEEDPVKKRHLQKTINSKKLLHNGTKVLCGYSKAEQNAYKTLLEECKLIDCFRLKNKDIIDQFTWFNIRIPKSVENNIGWLIDRFLIQNTKKDYVKECKILSEIGIRNDAGVFVSDHLPIYLEICKM